MMILTEEKGMNEMVRGLIAIDDTKESLTVFKVIVNSNFLDAERERLKTQIAQQLLDEYTDDFS